MKKLFIVANWKSNKTIIRAEEWFRTLNISQLTINREEKEVIICPPFTLLPFVKELIVKGQLPIVVGAQNVSPFEEGAYTGEVSARQVKELADYVIVGHSERRKNFVETEDIINKKIKQSLHNELTSILCVSDVKQIHNSKFIIHNSGCIVAYEPLFAIGSGHPDSPENANSMGIKIKEILGDIPILYGGSVTSDNVKSFTSMPHIDGVLVGGASLDPLEFLKIAQNA